MLNAIDSNTCCPFCGYKAEAASCVTDNGKKPNDGDISMCFRCGEWAVFASFVDGGLRKPNSKEYDYIASDEKMAFIRKAWLDLKEKREAKAKAPPEPERTSLGPLDEAFHRMEKEVYGGKLTTKAPPDVQREFRRLFYYGAASAMTILITANDDPDSDTVIFGTAFDEIAEELVRYKDRMMHGKE